MYLENEPLTARLRQVLVAGAWSSLPGICLFLALVHGMNDYTVWLFACTPVLIGLMAPLVLERRRRHRLLDSVAAVLFAHVLIIAALLLLAFEGAICILMAAPLSVVGSAIGVAVGRAFSSRRRLRRPELALLLVLPVLTGAALAPESWPERRVVTSIDIAASPDVVWEHVVGFSELEPPSRLVFRLGIAHPRSARIEGSGVGAVRYCVFSTGAFVEPITAWEPGRRLAFDVTAQPEPMHEWSPYRHVHAPHLRDGLVSRRGEFRLCPLASGGTRLVGTTWYEVRMGPQVYWGLWSDWLIGTIHERVLEHVRLQAERSVGGPPPRR